MHAHVGRVDHDLSEREGGRERRREGERLRKGRMCVKVRRAHLMHIPRYE